MKHALLLGVIVLANTVLARPLCQHVTPAARTACDKQWTVLIYMNGDNDLAPHTFADLKEMSKVGSSLAVDVVVQQDTDDNKGSRRYHVQRSENLADSLIATLT